MLAQLQMVWFLFKAMIGGVSIPLLILLLYAFPGLYLSFRKKERLCASGQGRLTVLYAIVMAGSVAALLLMSFYLVFGNAPVAEQPITWEHFQTIRGQLSTAVVMLVFCICALWYITFGCSALSRRNEQR